MLMIGKETILAGKLKRIRETAFSMKVSPVSVNRIVDSSRCILNEFVLSNRMFWSAIID